jgi:hypothetical protein
MSDTRSGKLLTFCKNHNAHDGEGKSGNVYSFFGKGKGKVR